MRALRLADIVDIDTYERIRSSYRARILDHKKLRRVSVGPRVSLVFEDRETLRYQILEMTRIERTTDPAKVQTEIDVYNDLIPGENELSATLFIEIPELDQVRSELDRLIGIDEHVALVIDSGAKNERQIPGRFDPHQLEEDRISAVHYLRFSLCAEEVERFEAGARASLRIDHPHYRHEAELCGETRASLLRDLRDATPELLDSSELSDVQAPAASPAAASPNVQVRKLSPLGSRTRVVVETKDRAATFLGADPALVSELMRVAQQIARELQSRAGGARIRMDAPVDGNGALRIEISAPAESFEAEPVERGQREPRGE
jgi:hypothetical protein